MSTETISKPTTHLSTPPKHWALVLVHPNGGACEMGSRCILETSKVRVDDVEKCVGEMQATGQTICTHAPKDIVWTYVLRGNEFIEENLSRFCANKSCGFEFMAGEPN
jgi:hypothetical protein